MYGLQKGSQLTEAFVKTADKNIVDWYKAGKSEVYLDKLQQQIDDVQRRIEATQPITEIPLGLSTEIMRAIENYNEMLSNLAELEEHKASLEELQAKCLQAEPIPIGL